MNPTQIGSTVGVDKESNVEGSATDAEGVDDTVEETRAAGEAPQVPVKRRPSWRGSVVYGLVPGLALLLAITAGYLKWQESALRFPERSRGEIVKAATDAATAMLSYNAQSVEQDLNAAQDRLTGTFKESYGQLINDVVIPGAKAQRISAVVRTPAAGPVSIDQKHAVVLVFVNQAVTVGEGAPTDTSSVVRVSMDKVDDQWLVSGFEPI
jgi:Mce-associated membrane protein